MKDQQALNKAGRFLLKQLSQKQRSRLLLAVFMGVLATVAMIMQWYALAQLTYDLIIQQQPLVEQSMLILLMVLSLILRSVLIRAQEHYSQLASLQAREFLREQVLSGWRQTSALIHSLAATIAGSADTAVDFNRGVLLQLAGCTVFTCGGTVNSVIYDADRLGS